MRPQILNQRQAPLEGFDVFAHDALLPPEPSVGEWRRQSQATMVGERIFFKDATDRELREQELSTTAAPLRQGPDVREPANELRGRGSGRERTARAEKSPGS